MGTQLANSDHQPHRWYHDCARVTDFESELKNRPLCFLKKRPSPQFTTEPNMFPVEAVAINRVISSGLRSR